MSFTENAVINNQEFAEGKEILKSLPTSLVVTLTTRCDINCLMCEEKPIKWEMPDKILNEIVSLMPYLEQIIWQGGEVLLLDYFPGLMKEAMRHENLFQSLVTNGLNIDGSIADLLVRDRIELIISIDGTDEKSYSRIRKGGDFNRLLKNIGLINSLRKDRQPSGFSFRMHAVIMRSNYTLLEKFIPFAASQGFDALHLMPIWGNAENGENIFEARDKEALDFIRSRSGILKQQAEKYKINFLNSLPSGPAEKEETDDSGSYSSLPDESENSVGMPYCRMPWTRMVINPAGNICPACQCSNMAGNIIETDLKNIWNGPGMREYRRRLTDGSYSKICSRACVEGEIDSELRGFKKREP